MDDVKMGCRFDPYDSRDKPYRRGKITIPKSVDNREYITPIKNQLDEGCCVGFAVTKTVEMAYWKNTLNQPNLSERWAYEHAKKYDEWPGTNYEGSSVRGGLKAAHKIGICEESYWPYRSRKKGRAKRGSVNNAKNFRVKKYYRVKGLLNLKAALFSKGVVVASATIHTGWLHPSRRGVIKFKPKFNNMGGHAFVIAGYNKIGFWIVNSWGESWGKKGTAILKYEDARLHLIDSWTIKL